MRGPFLWGARAQVRRRGDGYECRWTTGERHWRRVEVRGREIVIEDRVSGAGAALCFTLGPLAELQLEGSRATVRNAGTQVVFEADAIAGWRSEPGEVAPRFATVVPAPRLVAALSGQACRTVIRVGA